MKKPKSFLSILIPSVTVFTSSACIMILELVASRLIAKHLGSSLYTWTSVIGVVLAGITIGNYLGGRVADRFSARKALAVLFGVCSVASVVVVILNNIVGDWLWLWKLSWPVRVFTHVSLVFLIPSSLLGMISPVVAKMALDQGLPTGRTVGDIYAWGAAGSIAGTFLAGFYLIATMGTTAIIWTIGVVLLLMGILYWAKLWILYIWAAIFIAFMTMGMAPAEWAASSGSTLGLRAKPNPNILYEDETAYCYVAVKRISDTIDHRAFMQDKLKHSEMIMGDILNLQYFYSRVYAVVTAEVSGDKKKLAILTIGGGGYVFPRYIEKVWPGSRVDVAEIDPRVTEAAMAAFGLDRNTTINTITMDARNYVDDLLEKKRHGEKIIRYDFIYEDAINDYSVPFQLVTKEFNDKVAEILADDGVYMVNLIDIFDSGLFLGAVVNTLEQTFSYIHVISEPKLASSDRATFVVIAANRELNLENLAEDYNRGSLELWHLNPPEMEQLKTNSGNIILSDDYAPVENLMAPVVRQSAVEFLAGKYLDQAEELSKQGRFDESLRRYEDVIRVEPARAVKIYNEMGMIFARQGKKTEAIKTFQKAIEANEKAEIKGEIAGIHYNLALLLKEVGKPKEAKEQLGKAIALYREGLAGKYSNSPKVYTRYGDALAESGNFHEASEAFAKAVALNPTIPSVHMKLVQSLEYQGRLDKAIDASKQAREVMSKYKQTEVVEQFKKYTDYLIYKKSKTQ